MIKSDVSAQYKTKECKKYAQNGYCPYGMRCQFIHGQKENFVSPQSQTTASSSQKDISVSDFNATFVMEDKINLTPQGNDTLNSSGKNFFEFINIQNKTIKSKQILLKKPTTTVNAKKAPYTEIFAHCINVSLQEQQKKLSMYQKKIEKKVAFKARIEKSSCCSPDF